MVDLATGAWIGATCLFWSVGAMVAIADQPRNIAFTIAFTALFAALLSLGCWRFRSGSNAWRVFFTVLSGSYAVLTPLGFVNPNFDLSLRGFSILMTALGIAGIVCAWLPETNRYFRALSEHVRARKSAQYQEFLRTNPPPESIRRKMD